MGQYKETARSQASIDIPDEGQKVVVSSEHLRLVLVPLFCSLAGYTDKTVRRKIEEDIWLQGRHYRKAPDGRTTIDLQAYYAWVEGRDQDH